MNVVLRLRLGLYALALLCINLTTIGAKAQAVSTGAVSSQAQTTPPGFDPGWSVDVRRTIGAGAAAPGAPLVTFAAPAAGFDMGGYRGAVDKDFAFGVAYDASGMLNVTEKGRHDLIAIAHWGADVHSGQAKCDLQVALDTQRSADWSGTVGPDAGQKSVLATADLTPGLHRATLHAACDRPIGSLLRIDIAVHLPGEAAPRPPGPLDIVHAGPRLPSPAESDRAVAMRDPQPPIVQPPPTVPRAAAPPSREVRIATADIRIRARPRAGAATLGILQAGERVEVAGPAPDPDWVRLVRGGYAAAAFLKPPGPVGR